MEQWNAERTLGTRLRECALFINLASLRLNCHYSRAQEGTNRRKNRERRLLLLRERAVVCFARFERNINRVICVYISRHVMRVFSGALKGTKKKFKQQLLNLKTIFSIKTELAIGIMISVILKIAKSYA